MLQMLLCLLLAVGPLQQGPWVYGARENSVNILWVSEKPGMAYVELADGTVHFVPLLNKAGIDLMIGADLHTFMYCKPGTMGNDFPIIVNDDAHRLKVSCDRKNFTLKMFNPEGKLVFER